MHSREDGNVTELDNAMSTNCSSTTTTTKAGQQGCKSTPFEATNHKSIISGVHIIYCWMIMMS